MKVKEESEKVGLKINIQKTKIMAPGPITSRQINGETVERVADFIFLSSKITADGDCSREIEKTLAPWKKSYNEPRQHIKKQGHYFANKGPSSQGYGEGNGSPLQFMPGESQGLGVRLNSIVTTVIPILTYECLTQTSLETGRHESNNYTHH